MIEGIRKLTDLLAVGEYLGNVAGNRACANAGVRVANDRPRDRGTAGQVGGGVAVSVLHPCRDSSLAFDVGAIDKHVLDLAVDGEGALVELSAAVALDCKEKILVSMMMLD
jgi:hypothetical protein